MIMKIKTKDLIGAALDWAVAQCEGGFDIQQQLDLEHKPWFFKMRDDEDATRIDKYYVADTSFSTDWVLGGPIIEQNDISFRKYHRPDSPAHGTYYAKVCRESGALIQWSKKLDSTGPTPLIAAMRCYVKSKLGDEIEIPEELC
jgi:hypothetical protein